MCSLNIAHAEKQHECNPANEKNHYCHQRHEQGPQLSNKKKQQPAEWKNDHQRDECPNNSHATQRIVEGLDGQGMIPLDVQVRDQLPGVPTVTQARRVFERALIASLGSTDQATSVGYNLRALQSSAFSVRERLSQEHWAVINKAEADLTRRSAMFASRGDWAAMDAIRMLDDAIGYMAAITGAQTDRMTRDDGWRLLSIGRHIERMCFFVPALQTAFDTGAVPLPAQRPVRP